MRKDIIQSKTEPNKNNIWLSEEGLKKYGKNGWEPLGGGVSPNTPIVDTISGNELIPINQNGENKAVRADELIKGGKEVFIVTPDMFVETATVAGQPSTLTFTDEGWSELIKAIEANKIIVLDIAVASYIINSSTPYDAEFTIKGYFVLSYVTLVDGIVQGYFNVDMGEGIISYNIVIISKSLTSTMKPCSEPSSVPYIFNYTNQSSVTQDEYDGLKNAINSQRQIVLVFSEGLVVIPTMAVFFDNTITLQYQDGSNIGGIVITSDLSTSIQFIGLATQESVNDLVPYIWNGTTSETIFNELKSAIEDSKFIIYNSAMLIGFDNNDFLILESLLPFNNKFLYINSEYIKEIPADNRFIKLPSTTLNTASYSYYNIEEDTTFNIVSGDDLGEEFPIINEYNGEFTFGDTVYTVTFPEEVKWSTDSVLEYKANHTYQFRILNNLGVMKEFANA